MQRDRPSRVSLLSTLALLLMAACRGGSPVATALVPVRLPAAMADTVRSEIVAPGVLLHTVVNTSAPWRAAVLAVDLRCARLLAVKGGPTAVGRTTTSALLAGLPPSARALAAVNADFFLFAPPGVPTNAHVENGVPLAGPDARPVFWAGEGHTMGFDTLRVQGVLRADGRSLPLTAWNRPAGGTSGIIDRHWGVAVDTLVGRRTWRLDPVAGTQRWIGPSLGGRYVVRERTVYDSVVHGDTLLLHVASSTLMPAAVGDTVTLSVMLTGSALVAAQTGIQQAVGGRPILLRDSVITADVDTEGNAGFRGLNPRTAAGLDRNGIRLWLVVIDGRQPGRSMGMTLRQTGLLLQALGAIAALNLDGGGSSALALRDLATGAVRVVNTPSDPVERPVGNAMAVLSTCAAR